MEVLLPGLVLVLVLLLILALVLPGLVVVLALALPVGAMMALARVIHGRRGSPGPVIARAAGAALTGAAGGAGVGLAPRAARPGGPGSSTATTPSEPDLAPRPRRSAGRRQPVACDVHSGEPLFVFDRDLTVVSWNEGVAELTGIPVEQALGRPCWELLGGVDLHGNLVCHAGCAGGRLASSGSPVEGQRLLIKTASGARRDVWLSTIAVGGGENPLALHLLRNGSRAD